MRTDRSGRRLDEIEALCFARLYRGSPCLAADRGSTPYRHRRSGLGGNLAEGDRICDERLLLLPVEPGDGRACRVNAFTLDHAARPGRWRIAGGAYCALWLR